jgi:hypothetical protein
MIPSSTIDFDVIEARQNGQSAVSTVVAGSFLSTFFPRQISVDLRREVVNSGAPFSILY